jgi:hypothetical protein
MTPHLYFRGKARDLLAFVRESARRASVAG